MVRSCLGVAIAIALTAGGCKRDPSGDATKVTVASKDNATKPLVDDSYRFELAWPGAGWKLMHQRDASRIVPDAIAGAVNGETVFGVVIVEAAPGVPLEGYADALIEKMPLENKQTESRERVKFAGTDAVRFVVTGAVDGVPFRYVELAFLHQGYGYQLLGWGTKTDLAESGAQLQPLFDSFKLLPGKVSGRASTPIVTTAHGVGWRVKNGVFESAVTGLRVRVKEPWRLLVGTTLEQSNDDAEVGISHVDPEVFTVIIAERAPAPALRAKFIEQLRANITGDRGKPWIGKFAGKELEFASITSTGAMAFEYLHGVHIEGDMLFQVLAWYVVGDRERASRVVQSGLDSFDFMPPAESAAVTAELAKLPDTQSAVGLTNALRDGVYHSFSGGWTWTKPPEFWRVSVGDKARAFNPDSEMTMVEPRSNIYGLVISEAHEGGKAYHDIVVANMPGTTKSRAKELQLGAEQGYETTIDNEEKGVPSRFRLATVSKAGRAVQLLFWGTRGDIDSQSAVVDAAIRGFKFDSTPAIERVDGEYRDHRFGFAVKMPTASWRFTDETPADTRAIQTFVTWKLGISAMTGVVALHVPVPDEQWFLDFIEQSVRDNVGTIATGAAKRTEATLGGRPARRLEWKELDVYVMLRGGVIYAFMTTRSGQGPGAFRFLDN